MYTKCKHDNSYYKLPIYYDLALYDLAALLQVSLYWLVNLA